MPRSCTATRTPILEDTQRRAHLPRHRQGEPRAGPARRAGWRKNGEIVGVMMPNLAATVALLLGLSAMRRVAGDAQLHRRARTRCAARASRPASRRSSPRGASSTSARLEARGRGALHRAHRLSRGPARRASALLDKLWLIGWALWRPRAAIRPAATRTTPRSCSSPPAPRRAPRASRSRHGALLANMAQMGAVIDFGPNDTLPRLAADVPLLQPDRVHAACRSSPGRGCFLYTTPLHYHVIPRARLHARLHLRLRHQHLPRALRAPGAPLRFLQRRGVVVSGAEKLNPEVAQLWLREFGLRIMEGYGATECAPVLSLNTPLAYRPGTVGPPAARHRAPASCRCPASRAAACCTCAAPT